MVVFDLDLDLFDLFDLFGLGKFQSSPLRLPFGPICMIGHSVSVRVLDPCLGEV